MSFLKKIFGGKKHQKNYIWFQKNSDEYTTTIPEYNNLNLSIYCLSSPEYTSFGGAGTSVPRDTDVGINTREGMLDPNNSNSAILYFKGGGFVYGEKNPDVDDRQSNYIVRAKNMNDEASFRAFLVQCLKIEPDEFGKIFKNSNLPAEVKKRVNI